MKHLVSLLFIICSYIPQKSFAQDSAIFYGICGVDFSLPVNHGVGTWGFGGGSTFSLLDNLDLNTGGEFIRHDNWLLRFYQVDLTIKTPFDLQYVKPYIKLSQTLFSKATSTSRESSINPHVDGRDLSLGVEFGDSIFYFFERKTISDRILITSYGRARSEPMKFNFRFGLGLKI